MSNMSGVGAHHTVSQRHSSFSLLLFIILYLQRPQRFMFLCDVRACQTPRAKEDPTLQLCCTALSIHSHLYFYMISGQKQLWWCHQWCPLLRGKKKDSSVWQRMSVINLRVLGKPTKLASLWLMGRNTLLALEGSWVSGDTAMCVHRRSWKTWNFILSLNI